MHHPPVYRTTLQPLSHTGQGWKVLGECRGLMRALQRLAFFLLQKPWLSPAPLLPPKLQWGVLHRQLLCVSAADEEEFSGQLKLSPLL